MTRKGLTKYKRGLYAKRGVRNPLPTMLGNILFRVKPYFKGMVESRKTGRPCFNRGNFSQELSSSSNSQDTANEN